VQTALPNPSRLTRGLAAASIGAVFAARLWRLTALPIFVDESVQLLWGRGLVEHRWGRVLGGGKVLHVWAASALVGLEEPLLWARVLAVALGAVALWAAYEGGRRLGDETTGLVAAAFYVASPFAFFHERLSLADVYLNAAAALALVASVRLAEKPTLAASVLAAGPIALGVLAKAYPGIVLAAFPAVAWGLMPRDGPRPVRYLAATFVLVLAAAAYPVVYFATKTHEVQKAAGAEAGAYASLVLRNAGQATEWLADYWTTPVFVLVVLGAGIALVGRDRRGAVALSALVITLLAVVLTARVWYARYLLFATVPAMVLAAIAVLAAVRRLPRSFRRTGFATVVAVALAPGLVTEATMLIDPGAAAIPEGDRFQYIEGWPAGYGTREAADYLRAQAARVGRARVVMDDAGDQGPYRGIEAMAMANATLELIHGNLSDEATLLREAASTSPTFFVFGRPSDDEPPAVAPRILKRARRAASFFNRSGEPVLEVFARP
jgi:hypothetical protein